MKPEVILRETNLGEFYRSKFPHQVAKDKIRPGSEVICRMCHMVLIGTTCCLKSEEKSRLKQLVLTVRRELLLSLMRNPATSENSVLLEGLFGIFCYPLLFVVVFLSSAMEKGQFITVPVVNFLLQSLIGVSKIVIE